jgi:hypothetical protein
MKDISDTAVEAPNHAVGLGAPGLGQTVVNGVAGTDLIKGMFPGWLALPCGTKVVRELLSVIGQHLAQ